MLKVNARRSLLHSTALVGSLYATLWGGAALAQAQTYSFDIPSEPLSAALRDYARVSGQQIIFTDDLVAGKRAAALHGTYSADDALAHLLTGTTLVVDRASNGAIMVRSKNAEAASNEGAASPDIETVTVTGSRIPLTTKQGAQEVRTYTRQRIEKSGQGTVADFLSTLPEVSVSSIDSSIGNYADQTTVQLHGLPMGTTLVLLNGRRVEINNYGFFDLNNVPVAALERVEVLPVGSSAIYGADALAGAVNFVLRKDFTGLEATARYGHAQGTDETDFNLSGGYSWDRASVSLVASYQTRSELLGTERAITRDPDNLAAAFGEGDVCNPGTVYSLNGGNLPGLSSPVAGIPAGL